MLYVRVFCFLTVIFRRSPPFQTHFQTATSAAMLARYNRILHEYPVRANALTGLVLGAVGDILAQRLERQTLADQPASSIDREQCLRAASFAAAVNGLFIPWWYRTLDSKLPGTGMRVAAAKSLLDVVVNGGIGNALGIAARGAPATEVASAMPRVMAMDCIVWIPYNMVAFSRIPLHVRPTTTAVMTLGWNTYLSYVATRGIENSIVAVVVE